MASAIDAVDYGILWCIDRAGAAWKKKVHHHLMQHQEKLPQSPDISVQTVGRRINDLHEQGLIENCIASPDDSHRDLVITYKLTDAGRAQLTQKQNDLLRETALETGKTSMFHPDGYPSIEELDLPLHRAALAQMLCDRFEVDEDTKSLIEESTVHELLFITTSYCIREKAATWIDRENEQRMAQIILNTPELRQVSLKKTVSTCVRTCFDRAKRAVPG